MSYLLSKLLFIFIVTSLLIQAHRTLDDIHDEAPPIDIKKMVKKFLDSPSITSLNLICFYITKVETEEAAEVLLNFTVIFVYLDLLVQNADIDSSYREILEFAYTLLEHAPAIYDSIDIFTNLKMVLKKGNNDFKIAILQLMCDIILTSTISKELRLKILKFSCKYLARFGQEDLYLNGQISSIVGSDVDAYFIEEEQENDQTLTADDMNNEIPDEEKTIGENNDEGDKEYEEDDTSLKDDMKYQKYKAFYHLI